MQELINMKFGPYQIQSHLATGGMANIYLACNVEAEGEPLVAIKLVHISAGEYCELFRHETQELYKLHHEHILPVITYGEHNCWYYMVTPYIKGGTLKHRLDQGPLSLQEVAELFAQLAGAVHYAHEQGIVHRDIKSSNILMRDEHYAYLADFGLVKHVGLGASPTLSGSLFGTPEYMAPELIEEEASPRSDIYALGILLYQMLTGQLPFKGGSPINICLKHIHEQPVAPSVLNPATPPEIERVVLRALAKNPDERYQTAQDFNMDYQHALAQANARLLERDEATAHLWSTTALFPRVRIVEIGSQYQLGGAQQQKATLREQAPGFIVFIAVLVLAILSLQSTSGKSAQQPSPTQLATKPPTQVVHDQGSPTPIPSPNQGSPTPIPSPTPPATPTFKPTPTPPATPTFEPTSTPPAILTFEPTVTVKQDEIGSISNSDDQEKKKKKESDGKHEKNKNKKEKHKGK